MSDVDEPQLFNVPASKIVPVERVALVAFHSGFTGKMVTRLHVLRDVPTRRKAYPSPVPAGRAEGWCGTPATPTLRAPVVYLDPMPSCPPEGLCWCPMCLGRLAERLGLLDQIGVLLAGATPR